MAAAVAGAVAGAQRMAFGFGGRVLALDVDDPACVHVLQTTYAPLRLDSARAPAHTAALRRLGDGRLHVRFDRRAIALGSNAPGAPLLSAYYALKEVFARFLCAQRTHVAFYGALTAVEGRGLLLLGPAGIGKTVLALHLAALGARFLGDESAALDLRTRTIRALPRTPSLRESALLHLPAPLAQAIAAAPHAIATPRGRFWYALAPQDAGGIAPSEEPYRLSAVCLLRARGELCTVERVDPRTVESAVLQRTYERPSQLLETSALKRALRDLPFFEMEVGEPRASAAALVEELQTCG